MKNRQWQRDDLTHKNKNKKQTTHSHLSLPHTCKFLVLVSMALNSSILASSSASEATTCSSSFFPSFRITALFVNQNCFCTLPSVVVLLFLCTQRS